jgi:helix-turn-helix protein
VSETPIRDLLTVKERAEYLRIPSPTVTISCTAERFRPSNLAGRWRIKKSALDQEILRQDKQGQPTVLVVDDDLGLQDLFRTFFEANRF